MEWVDTRMSGRYRGVDMGSGWAGGGVERGGRGGPGGQGGERGRQSRYHCKLTINELALIKEPPALVISVQLIHLPTTVILCCRRRYSPPAIQSSTKQDVHPRKMEEAGPRDRKRVSMQFATLILGIVPVILTHEPKRHDLSANGITSLSCRIQTVSM